VFVMEWKTSQERMKGAPKMKALVFLLLLFFFSISQFTARRTTNIIPTGKILLLYLVEEEK